MVLVAQKVIATISSPIKGIVSNHKTDPVPGHNAFVHVCSFGIAKKEIIFYDHTIGRARDDRITPNQAPPIQLNTVVAVMERTVIDHAPNVYTGKCYCILPFFEPNMIDADLI